MLTKKSIDFSVFQINKKSYKICNMPAVKDRYFVNIVIPALTEVDRIKWR